MQVDNRPEVKGHTTRLMAFWPLLYLPQIEYAQKSETQGGNSTGLFLIQKRLQFWYENQREFPRLIYNVWRFPLKSQNQSRRGWVWFRGSKCLIRHAYTFYWPQPLPWTCLLNADPFSGPRIDPKSGQVHWIDSLAIPPKSPICWAHPWHDEQGNCVAIPFLHYALLAYSFLIPKEATGLDLRLPKSRITSESGTRGNTY